MSAPSTYAEPPSNGAVGAELVVRPLREEDVEEADRIMRLAFGTYLGVPEPMEVFGDVQYVRPRFAAAPGWAVAAELDGELVGSNFATRWGSFGFFGPLTVRPDLWDQGVGGALVEAVVSLFEDWGVRQAALFTFPQSPKHIGLYQNFGFWPQHLTPLLERQLAPGAASRPPSYSGLEDRQQDEAIGACRTVTDAIFEGLDLEHEILATEAQGIGDTVLLDGDAELDGFAVCHLGAGEAGSGTCFVKFAAVRPGPKASVRFERLVDACEDLARSHGLGRIVAGVNAARHDAYRRLLGRGYRTWMEGVIMQRPNEPGFCRPDVYVIDDLR
ncbi:MAG: GNAT family N-acetyltransferase [Actinobacteria bacterium]|nr:GNAT family N-acetyltransferase [Actinomycetota bacterium]